MTSNNYIFGFVGASGSGKSTMLTRIHNAEYDVDCNEISPRFLFDENKGSYDQQNTDEIQSQIVLHNIDMTHRMIEKSISKNKNMALTRTPLDVYAYCEVLGKATNLKKLLENTLDYLNSLRNYVFLYFPVDFSLPETNDKIRGNNNFLRNQTDIVIYNYLVNHNMVFNVVFGETVEEKWKTMQNILKKYGIQKKCP